MSDEWGEPVTAGSTIHDFETEPVLIGEYRRSDRVETRNGESTIHRFITDTGEQADCWGSVDLDGKLATVQEGQRVRIQFLGRKQLDSGRELKLFQVQVAKTEQHSVRVPDDDDIPF